MGIRRYPLMCVKWNGDVIRAIGYEVRHNGKLKDAQIFSVMTRGPGWISIPALCCCHR